jgi:hypothetical protein
MSIHFTFLFDKRTTPGNNHEDKRSVKKVQRNHSGKKWPAHIGTNEDIRKHQRRKKKKKLVTVNKFSRMQRTKKKKKKTCL